MSTAHLIESSNGCLVMGLDVNSERLTFSLESLPHLLGRGDLTTLKRALYTALGDLPDVRKAPGETEGEHIARMIRLASGLRYNVEA